MSKVNSYFSVIFRLFFLFIILILSGCSTYHANTENLATLPAQNAPVKSGQVEYYRFGQGTPIVLIPGYATDISSWNREFLNALAQQHQLIVLNNRHVGGSHIQSDRYKSQDLANDTYQLIQYLHLRKPAVLGISMGGMIAQQLAVLHPKKIGHLILINTAIAGKTTVHPSPEVETALLNMPESKLGRYQVALKLFFPPDWKARMAYVLAFDRFRPLHYQEIDVAKVLPAQRALILAWLHDDKTAQKIKTLPMPTLILNGEADIVIPPINSVILLNAIPRAQLYRWKEGGHALNYQFPRKLALTIDHFISNKS